MGQDDPEKRVADLEDQLGGQKRDADLRPAHHNAEMAYPSQIPGYRRRRAKRLRRRWAIAMALLAGGTIGVTLGGCEPGAMWFGVLVLGAVLLVLCGLMTAIWLIGADAYAKKDRARRECGVVQLLTVASKYFDGGEGADYWKLTSEMQIRLDSGRTFRGSYHATLENMALRRTRPCYFPDGVEVVRPGLSGGLLPHFDEWFVVGASMRCLYNPTNPDKVAVLPSAARGDRMSYNEFVGAGSDYVWFYTAT